MERKTKLELPSYNSARNEEFVTKVKDIINDNNRIILWTQKDKIAEFNEDKSYHEAAEPDIVVFPTTAEEVSSLVKLCNQYLIPITPRGAGTGLEGGCIAYCGGVVLCTSHFNQIRIKKHDLMAEVGAGVLKNELNAALKKEGFIFGPDPSSNPSLGGMASTGGSGMSTLKYGTTKENISSVLFVNAVGEIIRSKPKVRKASTGYDLTQLVMGSEGTLGIIIEVTVRIHPYLSYRAGAIVGFETITTASKAVILLIQRINYLVRCELLNAEMMKCNNRIYSTKHQERPSLFIELQTVEEDYNEVEINLQRAVQLLQSVEGFIYCQISKNEEELDEIWSARRGCYYASKAYREKKGDVVVITDVCVPLSSLPQCISETEEDMINHNVAPLICAHIADGNFHCMIPFSPTNEEEKNVVHRLEKQLMLRAIAMGGVVSGEHGIGIGKIEGMAIEHSSSHVDMQIAIKKALDPNLILNPLKLFTYSKL